MNVKRRNLAAGSSFRATPFVWIVAVLGAAILGIQFIRPELTNPPVTADMQAPPEVQAILRSSCYNCHSNETRLPWFDRIVPAYWIAARDVRDGRKHLNFSEIDKLPAAQQRATLFESVSQIELGAMPLPAYKRVHSVSVVAPEQLAVLKKYLAPANPNQPASVRSARCSRPDFARQKNQWRPYQTSAPQHPEAIEKAEKRSLLLKYVSQLSFGMYGRVRGGESAAGKMPRQRSEPFPVRRIIRSGVSHEDGLVILRSPREQRRDERNPKASALVSE